MTTPDSAEKVFSALASPVRRHILDLLLEKPLAAADVAAHFDMARPSVSEHLKILREGGLVSEERQGRYRMYSINAGPLQEVQDWLQP